MYWDAPLRCQSTPGSLHLGRLRYPELKPSFPTVISVRAASQHIIPRNYMGISKNRGTPKSSILIGFSLINHPFWGTPILGNTLIILLSDSIIPPVSSHTN